MGTAYKIVEERSDGKTRIMYLVPYPPQRGLFVKVERAVEFECPRCLAGPFVPCRKGEGLTEYQARVHPERRALGRGRQAGSKNRTRVRRADKV
ncbi:MAG: hypothetical protein B7733_18685 [Myxococcales bacterium FL481]|nr:MAG: hypothetical protein B7733_18685 [Myxococcales bacterium FL481]